MRVLVGLGLVVVGCYSPTFRPGTVCESACPGGLECIDGICREPGWTGSDVDAKITDAPHDAAPDAPDAAPGDTDADGLLDDVDNCPATANADQHDEDADVLGDACDPCPHLAGNASDGDADGVGDACDPQPTIGKQRITFFDPFTSSLPEWQYSGNTTRVGETLRANGANTASAILNIANGETRIATGGTIASVASGSPHQLVITVGIDAGSDVYHYAEFYDSGGSAGDISLTEASFGTYTGLASTPYTGILPTGAWSMQLDSSVAAQQMVLASKLGGVTRTPLTGDTSAAPALAASDRITLYISRADIRFDYFLVIETVP